MSTAARLPVRCRRAGADDRRQDAVLVLRHHAGQLQLQRPVAGGQPARPAAATGERKSKIVVVGVFFSFAGCPSSVHAASSSPAPVLGHCLTCISCVLACLVGGQSSTVAPRPYTFGAPSSLQAAAAGGGAVFSFGSLGAGAAAASGGQEVQTRICHSPRHPPLS